MRETIIFIILIVVGFLELSGYCDLSDSRKTHLEMREMISKEEYQALMFLKDIPEKSMVMATPRISTTVYAISQHPSVSDYYFQGKEHRRDSERFFSLRTTSSEKTRILRKHNVEYIFSKVKLYKFFQPGGWKLIYNEDGNYIYKKGGSYEKTVLSFSSNWVACNSNRTSLGSKYRL